MQSDSGRTTSLWMATSEVPQIPALDGDLKTEVCLIGAGIAGMTTAYLLARAGKNVVVLDDGPIGGGETGRTTAHLACAIDDYYLNIEKWHGAGIARIAAESHSAAINAIERIVGEEHIDCDFERVDGYLFNPPSEELIDLREEMEAANRAGLTEVELVISPPLPSLASNGSLRYPRQGQFHPLKYLKGLARCIQRDGGRIYTGAHVVRADGGTVARVQTDNGHTVLCKAIVVATNTPVNDRLVIHTKQAPYRTFAIGARVPAGAIPRALYWDTLEPYHYVRLQRDDNDTAFDVLIVGGEDHKTGHDDGRTAGERFASLEQWARRHFPGIVDAPYRWSGQVMETSDGLGYIGRNPRDFSNVYVATGDSGMGMTHGTIAGLMLSEMIEGRQHPWAEAYNPSRKVRSATMEWLNENLDVVAKYGEWFTGGDVDSVEKIVPGQGAVVRRGLRKIACYRDEAGSLSELSAVCTHMGCVVHFNSEEKTWDCPCHGSRFSAQDGHVINGPAVTGLEPLKDEKKAA